MYKVQSVIFHKSIWNVQAAIEWLTSNGFIPKKVDETDNFFRFRQHTPTSLKNAGYNTVRNKVLPNGVELIIYYRDGMDGGAMSWSDYAKSAYNIATYNPTKDIIKGVTAATKVYWKGRDKLIASAQNTVDQYGNETVVGMQILKTPLKSTLLAIINGVTFGQMSNVMDVNDYDKLFHLQLFVRVASGTSISMEKENTVKVSVKNLDQIKKEKDGETLPVPVTPNLTINTILKKTEEYMGTDKFFHYSSKDNNCQNFVNGMLEANGLANGRTNKFVKQNTQDAFNEWSRKVTNTVTDIGHLAETAFQGGSMGKVIIPKDYLNFASF
jgi:hypothetical protein